MLPVSLCLTTYNRAKVLSLTLDSLLVQSFGDFELIVSDDCSTDRTAEVVAAYQARDPRVRYRRNSTNLGMPGNLNAAIAAANGRYIANLHDGDIYRADLIDQWKSALDKNKKSPFVFNAYDCWLPSKAHRIDRVSQEQIVSGSVIARHYFSTLSSCVWGTVMTRRDAYQDAGPFDTRFGFISDVDMWLRLACGTDVAYVPEPLIGITPRESDKQYYGWPWRQLFWTIGIYDRALEVYREVMPAEVALYSAQFVGRTRSWALHQMLGLLRERRWERIWQGLAVWRDSPEPLLRAIGRALARKSPQPSWYSPSLWRPIAGYIKRERLPVI